MKNLKKLLDNCTEEMQNIIHNQKMLKKSYVIVFDTKS